MRGYYSKDQTLARDTKVSIAIDVHKESWYLSALSESPKPNHENRASSHGCLGGGNYPIRRHYINLEIGRNSTPTAPPLELRASTRLTAARDHSQSPPRTSPPPRLAGPQREGHSRCGRRQEP